MRKLWKWISCISLGLMMVGCGTQTTPEIIMPDQPMTSSVTEQTGSADADVQAGRN